MPLASEIQVRAVLAPHNLLSEPVWQKIMELRHACWKDYPNAPARKPDNEDALASHWLVTIAGELVASARASVYSELEVIPNKREYEGLSLSTPIGSLNRLVVAPNLGRRGIASQLDSLRIAHLRAVGCRCAVATSRSPRVEQLVKQGFTELGTLSQEDFPHYPLAARGKIGFSKLVVTPS